MKFLKLTLLAVIMTALLPTQANAKSIVLPKAYIFGFVANFTDSIIYVTDIQEVDSVWFDKKIKVPPEQKHLYQSVAQLFHQHPE